MWILLALGASMVWGMTYVFSEQIFKQMSVFTSLAFSNLVCGVILFAGLAFTKVFRSDLVALGSSRRLLGLSIAEAVALLIAEILICLSIANKNATLAGLIEISYPIFIAIFAWLLFRENQITVSSAIGGLLIFSGVFVIYYFNH